MTDPGGIGDDAQPGLTPGTRLGKYEIVRLLGAGGMGTVYEGAHTEMGKRVAIKVLSPGIAAIPGARARFLREAQITSRVRHPNIVDVTDMGSEGGQTYLVMELLRGEDLGHRLARTGPFAAQPLADIMLPVCSAMVEAHKVGVTHRDLKPQNIFLAEGPHATQPKILDFGISKGNDIPGAGSLTGTGTVIGTPYYLAPEQIMDVRAAGPASDQYALGVIMYECLTGARPFESENLFAVFQEIVAGRPIPPRGRRPDLPAALEAVVMRAMSLEPRSRFASAAALGRALLPFASERAQSIWTEQFAQVPDGEGDDLAAAVPDDDRAERVATRPARALERTRLAVGPRAEMPDSPAPRGWLGGLLRLSSARIGGMGVVLVCLIAVVAWQRTRSGSGSSVDAARKARVARMPEVAAPVPATPQRPAVTPPTNLPPPTGAVAIPRAEPRPAGSTPANPADPAPSEPAGATRTFHVSVRVQPRGARIELDGVLMGRGTLERELPLDHAVHELRLFANGYEEQQVEFTDEPPPSAFALKRSAPLPPSESDAPDDVAAETRPPSLVPDGAGSRVPPARPPRQTPRPRAQPIAPAPRGLNPNGAPVID